jgi:hypothetical protein
MDYGRIILTHKIIRSPYWKNQDLQIQATKAECAPTVFHLGCSANKFVIHLSYIRLLSRKKRQRNVLIKAFGVLQSTLNSIYQMLGNKKRIGIDLLVTII